MIEACDRQQKRNSLNAFLRDKIKNVRDIVMFNSSNKREEWVMINQLVMINKSCKQYVTDEKKFPSRLSHYFL